MMNNLFDPGVDILHELENSDYPSLWDITDWFNHVGFWLLLGAMVLIGTVIIVAISWFRRR